MIFVSQSVRGWVLIFLLFLLMDMAHSTNAQDEQFTLPIPIQFQRIGPEEGLWGTTTNAITQDSQGYMWFGTHDGLFRYDGYEFQKYVSDRHDPTSLSANSVYSLAVDDGWLWVGTWSGGLNRYDHRTDRFVQFLHDENELTSISNNAIRKMYTAQDGTFWVGTQAGGLNRFDSTTQTFIRYQNDPDDPTSLSHNSVLGIAEDATGNLWVGTNGGGLNRFDPMTDSFTRYQHDPDDLTSLASDWVWTVHVDQHDNLWVGHAAGLSYFEPATESFANYLPDPDDPNALGPGGVNVIHEDLTGTLWVGTYGDALYSFDRNTERFKHYAHDPLNPTSISGNLMLSLYEDDSGLLWIGTAGSESVSMLDIHPSPFTLLRNPSEAAPTGNEITYAFEDENGDLWVNLTDYGLSHYASNTGTFEDYIPEGINAPTRNVAYDIEHGQNSSLLWIGYIEDGFSSFDPATKIFTHYRHDPSEPNSLSENTVLEIWEDAEGIVWLATNGGGLDRFDPTTETFTHFRHDPDDPTSLSGDNLWYVTGGIGGVIWVGTESSGLNRFDPTTETFTHFRHDPDDPTSLSADHVLVIYETEQGELWVGTFNGLNRFDPATNTFLQLYSSDGLQSNRIQGIVEDQAGYLWLSYANGLDRLNPETLEVINYSARMPTKDGFTTGSYSSGPSGRLYFGTRVGLLVVRPDLIAVDEPPSHILLTDFRLANQSVPISDESLLTQVIDQTASITLDYTDNIFSIDFVALNYRAPAQVRYRYRLVGFDDIWRESDSDQRRATYTNLNPGTYTFEITATNGDSSWSDNVRTLTIMVLSPWWQTLSFQLSVLVAVVSAVIGGWYWRNHAIRRRNQELEVAVLARTAELDLLLQMTRDINSSFETDTILERILDYLKRVVDYDHAVIWSLSEGRLDALAWSGNALSGNIEPLSLSLDALPPEHSLLKAIDTRKLVVNNAISPELGPARAVVASTVPKSLLTYQSALAAPLIVEDEVIGILTVGHQQPGKYLAEAQRTVEAFANQAAITIKNAWLHEESLNVAAEQERLRLAHDLHDSVTQTLFSATMIADTLPAVWEKSPDNGLFGVTQLRKLTHGALAEMRTLLLELQPTDLTEKSLGTILRQLAEAMSVRAKMAIKLTIIADAQADPQRQIAIYRITQEVLNNAVKHSHAQEVVMELNCASDSGKLWIRDDGRGFETIVTEPGHFGLTIMQERAKRIDAQLTITSNLGEGTHVFLEW